jgi:hypothetical protein
MKRIQAITFLSFVAATYANQQHPAYATKYESMDVAKNGKDIQLLVEVMANGASTPKVLFAKTLDPNDEPKQLDYLTPIGTRQ